MERGEAGGAPCSLVPARNSRRPGGNDGSGDGDGGLAASRNAVQHGPGGEFGMAGYQGGGGSGAIHMAATRGMHVVCSGLQE